MPLANIASVILLFASPNVAGKPAVHLQAWQETEPQQAAPSAPQKDAPPEPTATQPKPDQAAPPSTEAVPAETPKPTPPPSKQKSKASGKKGRKSAKTTDPAPPPDGPTKKVVRNGSTKDPEVQFSSGQSQEQVSHQLQNTNQLLASAESNLKRMAVRQATPSQQETMKQVRMYMDQAKAAIGSGDLQRGHTLAFKARLLSDELVQH